LAGEEKLFYPVLQQKEELHDLVNHAFEEHNQIKSALRRFVWTYHENQYIIELKIILPIENDEEP
jgi:hypothetical protein